jgi:hypothetical protein
VERTVPGVIRGLYTVVHKVHVQLIESLDGFLLLSGLVATNEIRYISAHTVSFDRALASAEIDVIFDKQEQYRAQHCDKTG